MARPTARGISFPDDPMHPQQGPNVDEEPWIEDVSMLLLPLPLLEGPHIGPSLGWGRGNELSIIFAGKTSPGSPHISVSKGQSVVWSLCNCEKKGHSSCMWLELGGACEDLGGALQAASHLLGWPPEASLSPSSLLGALQVPIGTCLPISSPACGKPDRKKNSSYIPPWRCS